MRVMTSLLSILLLALTMAVHPVSLQASQSLDPPDHQVGEAEAMAVADRWYAMEVRSDHAEIEPREQIERLSRIEERQVFYLMAEDDLRTSVTPGMQILAFVVEYQPMGFVVVSGDDRIEPVIVFAIESEFRWDQPERNFLRYYLGKTLMARTQYVHTRAEMGQDVGVHPNWSILRTLLHDGEKLADAEFEGPTAVEVFVRWNTPAWDQGQFYNDVVVANNGNTTGIPTGCTATAMAMQMRFHSWPATGNSSHSYSDTWGSIRYSHSVNFGAQTYNWATMPVTNLTAANAAVANLMYQCGVAVDMDYEVGGSGAWPSPAAMSTYFRYKGTTELTSNHDVPMQASIRGGLPVILSSSVHTVLADGYRDTLSPYYHFNCGWGNADCGWYNLNQIPGGDNTIDRSYPYSAPQNYMYVDRNWTGVENGNIQNPYNTLGEGVAAVPSGGQLWIKVGSYTGTGNTPITISKAMTLQSYEGTATLGGP